MHRTEQLWRSLHVLARSVCVRVLVMVLVLGSALTANQVRADDLGEFEAARARYDRHDYKRAVEAFKGLVGRDPPRITNALLVLESRKYYAASLLFVGANEEARLQFRLLLQQEPDYALDPLAFPTDVVQLFESVKQAMRKDLDRLREAELERQRAAAQEAEAARLQRHENMARLRGLAEDQTLEVRNSRWVATVPFGIGQFQNGQRGLGVALAMAESIAAATSVITYFGHQGMVNDQATASNSGNLEQRERIWRGANWAAFGTFAVLAVAGVIDAHVRFVPARITKTPRPLPEDLDRWAKDQAKLLTAPPRF